MVIAFSVDLEPNKDGSLDGVKEVMSWVDETVPSATLYTTHQIATELPEMLADLSEDHELGVHVHPTEFGHDHDQFAGLPPQRQRSLVVQTRQAICDATGLSTDEMRAFRAGRHSASEATLSVLDDLGFEVDASVHVRYDQYLPGDIRTRQEPFRLDSGMLEIPTTWIRPPLLSRVGLRVFPNRNVTATSTTVRQDDRLCPGTRAMAMVLERAPFVSFYMHPYDGSAYHAELENAGEEYRSRMVSLLSSTPEDDFVTASDVDARMP